MAKTDRKNHLDEHAVRIYKPDSGSIFINGKNVAINSPEAAISFGIGMIHQHFKLVEFMTAADNIIMGSKEKRLFLSKGRAEKIRSISKRFGLEVDPLKKVHDMSVSEKQTVEILKVLYRKADILILDEPTAVLTPQETTKLFEILRKMKQEGCAIIIITHKLNEVMEISDRVTILRKGHSVATVSTAETNIKELTELMVGRPVELSIHRPEIEQSDNLIEVHHLTVADEEGFDMIKDVSFDLRKGEILGVAGVAGSGQKELCEAMQVFCPLRREPFLYN